MKEGTIKFFDAQKGFGFITPEEIGKDIFVHQTGLMDHVSDGDRVTYFEEEGKKGLSATNVKRIR
ncbi:cold-shock protein [Zhouia sp. PK063]|uniref:cold-shock protein n=1 Tax=Zhouia sp. PK063 TaxID=3373602 RepID=UPI00379D4404